MALFNRMIKLWGAIALGLSNSGTHSSEILILIISLQKQETTGNMSMSSVDQIDHEHHLYVHVLGLKIYGYW